MSAVHRRVQVGPRPHWRALAAQPPGWWGMLLAHFGVAVFVAGVTVVRSFQTETDLRMPPGSSVELGGRTLRLDGVEQVSGPNYEAMRATLRVSRDGRHVATLQPERRRYRSMPGSPMTEAAIDSGLLGDLYVSLGEPAGDDAWTVRVQHKPMVTWIWGGCALMALGAVVAAMDRRYRAVQRRPLPDAAVAAER